MRKGKEKEGNKRKNKNPGSGVAVKGAVKKVILKVILTVAPFLLVIACMGAVIGGVVDKATDFIDWLSGKGVTVSELYEGIKDDTFGSNLWGAWKTGSFKECHITKDSLQKIAEYVQAQEGASNAYAIVPATYYLYLNESLMNKANESGKGVVIPGNKGFTTDGLTKEENPEGTKAGWQYYSTTGAALHTIGGGIIENYTAPWQFYYLTYLLAGYDYNSNQDEVDEFLSKLNDIIKPDVEYAEINGQAVCDTEDILAWIKTMNGFGDGIKIIPMEKLRNITYATEIKQYDSSYANRNVTTKQTITSKSGEETKAETSKKTVTKTKASANTKTSADTGTNKYTFTYPFPEWHAVTAGYGAYDSVHTSAHNGTDIGNSSGAGIYACADGVVEAAKTGYNGGRGYYVSQRVSAEGYEDVNIIYQHCSEILVKEGDRVKQGDLIARVGSTGFSTGPHLHLEFDRGGFGRHTNTGEFLSTAPGHIVFAEKYGGKPASGNGSSDNNGSSSDDIGVTGGEANLNPSVEELNSIWGQAQGNDLLAYATKGDALATEINIRNENTAGYGICIDKTAISYPTSIPKKIDWFLGETTFEYSEDGKSLLRVKTKSKLDELNKQINKNLNVDMFQYEFVMESAENIKGFEHVGEMLENYRLQAKKGVFEENTRYTISVCETSAEYIEEQIRRDEHASEFDGTYTADADVNFNSLDETVASTFTGDSAAQHAKYIRMMGQCAHDYMVKAKKDNEYYVLPSVVIAQAITEAGWGTSNLARNASNFYGMNTSMYTYRNGKYDSWNGAEYMMWTLQGANSNIHSYESFRKFTGARQSTYNYIGFQVWMKKNMPNSHAAKMVDASMKGDVELAAKELGKSGYAMASGYGSAILANIRLYNLTRYDKDVLNLKGSISDGMVVNEDEMSGLTASEIIQYPYINTSYVLSKTVEKDPDAKEAGDNPRYKVTVKGCRNSYNLPASAGGMGIPYYCQTDPAYAMIPYGLPAGSVDSNVLNNACGPTSLAMIVSYFKQTSWTINDYIKKYGNSGYVQNKGLSHDKIRTVAQDFGISCKIYQGNQITADTLVTELKKGHPMIVSFGNAAGKYFTSGGHYVVLRGLRKTGNNTYQILVNDPADTTKKGHYAKAYGPQFIVNEICGKIAYAFYR